MMIRIRSVSFFFFNDTATTEIYTLSLHDALPIGDREEAVRVDLADVAGVEPAFRVDRLRRRLRLAEVALHHVRAAGQDLAVIRDSDLDVGKGAADGPQPPGIRAVDGDHRRSLGQAVSLVDRHARAEEELGEVARERGAPRDGKAEARPERVTDLRQHELVGEPRPAGERRRRWNAPLLVGNSLPAHAHGPGEELLLQSAARVDLAEDPTLDLLVDARHRAEAVRVHFQEVVPKLVDRLRVGD